MQLLQILEVLPGMLYKQFLAQLIHSQVHLNITHLLFTPTAGDHRQYTDYMSCKSSKSLSKIFQNARKYLPDLGEAGRSRIRGFTVT